MLKINSLSVCYGKAQILSDISFALTPHKITALLGRNGSGKSTLVSCINSSAKYTGEILFDDRPLSLMPARERARSISVLPQILPGVSFTVEELVGMGRNPYLDVAKRMSDNDKKHIAEAIKAVGLSGFEDRPVSLLSGGERQKAYLAMVLAQNTRVLVLDEPSAYMDMESEAEFLGLLTLLKTKHKKTILIVMHDFSKAVEIADNILILGDKNLVYNGTKEDCVQSGAIENFFSVRSSTYEKDGKQTSVYFR